MTDPARSTLRRCLPSLLIAVAAVAVILADRHAGPADAQDDPALPAGTIGIDGDADPQQQQMLAVLARIATGVEGVREEVRLLRETLEARNSGSGDGTRTLAFGANGRVVNVVPPGPVDAGAVIARLDQRDAALALERARQALHIAEMEFAGHEAGVEAARVMLEQAEAQAAVARAASDRLGRLDEADAAGRAALDAARAEVVNAEAKLSTARSTLEMARTTLDASGARIEPCRIQIARAEGMLEERQLVAPADGEIVSIDIAPGDRVSAGQPVATFRPSDR